MKFFELLLALFKDLNNAVRWNDLITFVGPHNIYVVLFLIIFAETGLVILPFLPGDSLLFAVGAISAKGDVGINLPLVTTLMIIAAILGDAVNYWIGFRIGPKVFASETSKLLNKKHLLKAHEFYEKYGGKTIILARFVPIIRTFAPFVAGVGKMNYFRFALYNVVGGIAWVLICVLAGVFFGKLHFVQKNFELVILAIIVISVLPVVIEFIKARREGKRENLGMDVLEATTVGEKTHK